MSLVVKDFEKQKIVRNQQVIDLVKSLPIKHLKGLTHIVFDPSGFYRRSYAEPKIMSSNILGEYNSLPTHYICINKFRNLDEFHHVLAHEVGHHVYQCFLTSIQRKAWMKLYREIGRFVSDYAQTNPEEDFAESYAFYALKKTRISRISSKNKFLSSVFN